MRLRLGKIDLRPNAWRRILAANLRDRRQRIAWLTGADLGVRQKQAVFRLVAILRP